MTHQITYLRAPDHAPATTTWVSPTGWSDDTIRRTFEERYPGSVVVSMEKLP